jgi:hypothetical protein
MAKLRNDLLKLNKDLKNIESFFKTLPDYVGNAYINFVQDNFTQQGFTDDTFVGWQPRKKKEIARVTKSGKEIEKPNRALLVNSGALRRSIRYKIIPKGGKKSIYVYSNIPYAEAHNEGLRIEKTVTVKAHSRKANGKTYGVKSHKRKVSLQMTRRQFMGESQAFNNLVIEYIVEGLKAFKK